MSTNRLVEVRDVRTWFEVSRGLLGKPLYVKAVDGVSLDIGRGESAAVVGESGSGKTTLGKTILRLYKPKSGEIYYNGRRIDNLEEEELKWYRREAQIIYQDPFGSLNPFFTVERILSEPLTIHNITKDYREIKQMINQALIDVKLEPPEMFASKHPHMLSGGQRQRVAIARALVLKPKLIVADEPVSMLDASVRVEIMSLLETLQKKYETSILYITHDLATIKYFSQTLYIMYAGKIIESGATRDVLKEPLHPYTQALVSAIPDPNPENRLKYRDVPAGEPPSPMAPPSGCRFHLRCPHFIAGKCDVLEPQLTKSKNNYVACHLYS
ncbi:MAG: ABC transporter ATP-binding protein [Thaumarchaeota archaeon]|nr:ABC transporter ATP-binding protein [Nitrososphaerota archaeon]